MNCFLLYNVFTQGGDLMNIYQSYNHFIANYTAKPGTKYDSHKMSELKDVCSRIASSTKSTPLYMVSLSDDTRDFAIHVKDSALQLLNMISYLGDEQEAVFNRMEAYSSNPEKVSAALLGTDKGDLPDELSLKATQLGVSQQNTGSFVPSGNVAFSAKEYYFFIDSSNTRYHFKIPANGSEDNITLQNKIANFVNKSNIDVKASVAVQGKKSALVLTSENTGIYTTGSSLNFTVSTEQSGRNLVDYFGLDEVTLRPQNCIFTLNDEEHESRSNYITLNSTLSVSFHEVSDEPTNISFRPSGAAILPTLKEFASTYNQLIDLAHSDSSNYGGKKLLYQTSSIIKKHYQELSQLGIHLNEDSTLALDENELLSHIASGEIQNLFSEESAFHKDATETISKLSLNPMDFVDKLIVVYPRIPNLVQSPYTPSIYSGLFYNNYL